MSEEKPNRYLESYVTRRYWREYNKNLCSDKKYEIIFAKITTSKLANLWNSIINRCRSIYKYKKTHFAIGCQDQDSKLQYMLPNTNKEPLRDDKKESESY